MATEKTIDKSINHKEVCENISAKHISGEDWKWVFSVSDADVPANGRMDLVLINTANEHRCYCQILSAQKNGQGETIMEADMSPLKGTIDNSKTERWKVHLAAGGAGEDATVILKDSDYEEAASAKKGKKDKFKRRFKYVKEPIGCTDLGDRIVEAVPDSVSGGDWIICVGDRCLRYMYALRCVGIESIIKHNKLYFKVACPDVEEFNWTGIVLSFRYFLEKDRTDYFFPFKSVSKENGQLVAFAYCDIRDLDFKPIYWDVRVAFQKGGNQFWCLLKATGVSKSATGSSGFSARVKNLVKKQTLDISENYQMTIGETRLNNTTVVVQESSPYNGFAFRLKERLAILIYLLMRRQLQKKKIFLVHEKFGTSAQENGASFFRYCMKNNIEKKMDRSIYYVIDKNAKDYANVAMYDDNVIQFMSIRHMVYSLAARLIISSDNKLHSYAWRAHESIIRPRIIEKKKLVFLQHGVIGLKRVPMFKKGLSGGCSLFITSNEMEKQFIMDNLGYSDDEVVVTGLARWDDLKDKSETTEQKHILMMPTWRNWLNESTDNVFLESEYFKRYMELINSDELSELLERHDLYFDFFIHPKLREHICNFSADNKRVKLIAFGSEPLNELMMECKLLITDYSSVCWDVYYQGKPVIFYQFDLDEYNEAIGSYMDLEKDLFGDRAKTKDELIKLLEEAICRGFVLKPKYAEMRKDMYKYIDHNNSKRICEEIMKRGW